MGNMFLLAGVSLLLWALVLFACASCSVRSSHKQSSYPLPTQAEKGEQSGYLGFYPTPQAKTHYYSLVDTSPLWGKPLSVEFWDFISDLHQEDE